VKELDGRSAENWMKKPKRIGRKKRRELDGRSEESWTEGAKKIEWSANVCWFEQVVAGAGQLLGVNVSLAEWP
jgi:hypothetical protein